MQIRPPITLADMMSKRAQAAKDDVIPHMAPQNNSRLPDFTNKHIRLSAWLFGTPQRRLFCLRSPKQHRSFPTLTAADVVARMPHTLSHPYLLIRVATLDSPQVKSLTARAEELQLKLEEAGESNRIITQAVRLKQDEVDQLTVINNAVNRQLKAREKSPRRGTSTRPTSGWTVEQGRASKNRRGSRFPPLPSHLFGNDCFICGGGVSGRIRRRILRWTRQTGAHAMAFLMSCDLACFALGSLFSSC